MKNLNKLKFSAIFVMVAIYIASCSKAPAPVPALTPNLSYNLNFYTLNQGAFGSGNASVSFYNAKTKTITQDIFKATNNRPLGDVAQSMVNFGNQYYIVVNNSGKTEVVNASTFLSTGTITGLNQPRYFLGRDSSTGYITQWGANGMTGSVAVVNLKTNQVTTTISTGMGAEGMVLVGNNLYVACNGGFGSDSVLSIINAQTNVLQQNIVVGANPQGIQLDANGKLWVLCQGQYNTNYTSLVKPAQLVRINPANNSIECTYTFSSSTTQPSNLIINSQKNTLNYIYNGGVYAQSISANTLSTAPLIRESFYGVNVDPGNYIFGGNAGNGTNPGWAVRYDQSGTRYDSVQVGIFPVGFCFQ